LRFEVDDEGFEVGIQGGQSAAAAKDGRERPAAVPKMSTVWDSAECRRHHLAQLWFRIDDEEESKVGTPEGNDDRELEAPVLKTLKALELPRCRHGTVYDQARST
jgi:hypothetical protein